MADTKLNICMAVHCLKLFSRDVQGKKCDNVCSGKSPPRSPHSSIGEHIKQK